MCAVIHYLLLQLRVVCFPGGVCGYFLITTTTPSFVFFGWRKRLFFISTTFASFVLFFRVACAVIFDYCYCHEFCVFFFRVACAGYSLTFSTFTNYFFVWRARLFLITTAIASFAFPGGVHVYFLIISNFASFVFSGGIGGYC